MSYSVTAKALYWILVVASVVVSFMFFFFIGANWAQFSAYQSAGDKAAVLICIALPVVHLILSRLSFTTRLGAALAVVVAQAGIILT